VLVVIEVVVFVLLDDEAVVAEELFEFDELVTVLFMY
jgi:hypothetical protein